MSVLLLLVFKLIHESKIDDGHIEFGGIEDVLVFITYHYVLRFHVVVSSARFVYNFHDSDQLEANRKYRVNSLKSFLVFKKLCEIRIIFWHYVISHELQIVIILELFLWTSHLFEILEDNHAVRDHFREHVHSLLTALRVLRKRSYFWNFTIISYPAQFLESLDFLGNEIMLLGNFQHEVCLSRTVDIFYSVDLAVATLIKWTNDLVPFL